MAEDAEKRINLLIIDDDRKLCRLLREYLQPFCFSVECAHDGVTGLERALGSDFDAIILDIMLPGMDGIEVLKEIRKKSDVPILMLTALGEESDRIAGLELGADDYLPKTFSSRELLARLRAVLRRARSRSSAQQKDKTDEIVVGPLRVIPSSRVALLNDKPLQLTPVEYDILESLAKARGRVKTREQLLDEVAGRDYIVFDRSIDVHISALRKKLGDNPKEPRFIRTVRSVGYMLVDPESDWSPPD